MQSPNNSEYIGDLDPGDTTQDANVLTLMIWSALRRVRTMDMAEVVGVTNAGGISPVGFVDLQPLVNQVDGAGNAIPHGVLYRCPYFRLQGGQNAVIIDPQVGDIGFAGFCDRDSSRVVTTKAQANPGSARMFDMADAVYFGGILNGTPSQYIAFSASGIEMYSPTKITLAAPEIVLQATETIGLTAGTEITNSAPVIELDGELSQGDGPNGGNASIKGTLTADVDVVANGISLHNHEHTSEDAGTPTSPPIAGT